MKNKSLAVAKTNFRNIKWAYPFTATLMGCTLIQDIVYLILTRAGVYSIPEGKLTYSYGNCLFLIVILVAIFIPAKNFRRMMNLGSKREDFFKGCFVTYLIMVAAVSLICVILYHTYDKLMTTELYKSGTLDVSYWFGWHNNGVIVAFLRQFAFLFLLATFVHTLTAIQDKLYGWVTDVLIVAIISVFTTIAPLRASLVWFLNLIIFHPNAFLQIAACLILATAIYSLNKLILARKAI